MIDNPLISIVIPIFNRADILSETLDSIMAQSYANWECILVDDGSTDGTISVIKKYIQKDSRFKTLQRPENRAKGANTCRNLGLEQARGSFIIFFDSDDLMTPDHITTKAEAIVNSSYDYVITKTKFFNAAVDLDTLYYNFQSSDITASHYITQKINWLTYDVCIDKRLAQSIRFNEALQSGQEYNYFCKLVLLSTNAKFIPQVVTLRRKHENSIRGLLHDSQEKVTKASFKVHWLTFLDIQKSSPLPIQKYLLQVGFNLMYKNPKLLPFHIRFHLKIFQVYGFRGCHFLMAILLQRFFNRGHYFKKRSV